MTNLEMEYDNLQDCLKLLRYLTSLQVNKANAEQAMNFVQQLQHFENDGWRNERIEEMNRLPVGND